MISSITLEKFKVPNALYKYIELILNDDDAVIIDSAMENGEIPSKWEEDILKYFYRRGIINKTVDGTESGYVLADFYTRLEYFMLENKSNYLEFPEMMRKDLDDWYVSDYRRVMLNQFNQTGIYKTEEVLPLEIVIERIKNLDTTVSIHDCDCRIFASNCDKPLNVCIHFNVNQVNTVFDRGYGRLSTIEEAIEVLKFADESGLIHAVGKGAICNCCSCCCYPFRTTLNENLKGKWPQTPYVATIESSKCIGCGACIPRCEFDALKLSENCVALDEKKCWGCGVCRPVCPTDAIQIKPI